MKAPEKGDPPMKHSYKIARNVVPEHAGDQERLVKRDFSNAAEDACTGRGKTEPT